MALETPNQIRANATALETLVSVGAPSTFDVRLLTSTGFAAVRLLDPDDEEIAVLTLSEEISPLEAAVFGNSNRSPFQVALFGGSPTAEAEGSLDAITPRELVVGPTGEFEVFEAGQQFRWGVTVFHMPLVGV